MITRRLPYHFVDRASRLLIKHYSTAIGVTAAKHKPRLCANVAFNFAKRESKVNLNVGPCRRSKTRFAAAVRKQRTALVATVVK